MRHGGHDARNEREDEKCERGVASAGVRQLQVPALPHLPAKETGCEEGGEKPATQQQVHGVHRRRG